MDWPLRLKVALGAARGLSYLHSTSAVGIAIVHRDFKSTNILLDDNYEAKVCFLHFSHQGETFSKNQKKFMNEKLSKCHRFQILVSQS